MDIKRYLIKKHGIYYHPEAAGYTSNISEAWKLPYDQAVKYTGSKGQPDEVSLEEAPPAKFIEGIPGFYSQHGEAVFLLSETGAFYKCVFSGFYGGFICSDIVLPNLESINFLINLTQISKEEAFNKLFEERREAWELRGGDLDELRELVNDFLQ